MAEPRKIPVPKLAATILLVRDGRVGLEVFMVERHHQIDFATGALVFPGGKVDPADAAPELSARCRSVSELDPIERSLRIAAIRETFEESGVLLARPLGSDAIVDASRLAEIEGRHREDLHAGNIDIGRLVEEEDLELACDLLVPFAHWITPAGLMPKRFDTWFFIVAAPPDHVALHDGKESVDSVWISPADATAAAKEKRRTIIFPTLMNLEKLGRNASASEAISAAAGWKVVTVLPRVEKGDDGRGYLVLPEEAGYEVVRAPVDEIM